MKNLLRVLLALLIITGLTLLTLFITNTDYLIKGVWVTYLHGENSATIDDARFFELREVPATNPQPWPLSANYNSTNLSDTLRETLEQTETAAFLVIKDGEIAYEEYWEGYSDTSHSNSFSMAKSITTLLVQKAIQDGHIGSWEDKVIQYLPELKGPYRQDLKLKHLSTMTAGLQWDESYTAAFSLTARAYYSDDIAEVMFDKVPVVKEPGAFFEYQSGAPQLLGLVLTRATGQTVSRFASETLWKSLGAEETALWHLDDDGGQELTYCCFNSNARDFARFGKLLIEHGKWEGNSVIDSAFISTATSSAGESYYGWSFWLYRDFLHPVFYMRGILGQYVIVIPEKDLVICRLGKERYGNIDHHPGELPVIIEEVVKYF